ncbi:MAG TPA: sigma-70 family RNA polymerase sigma factor [Isosphaeraceae bacterium]|jgi:RNA polymerase sigma-70 factor (ECF subfamily)|nr:sigma-70 family RNA polymerase sigma factor [Isosphaeraceae bacterium]
MPDWDAIVGQHGRLVWRTAYRLLGNHADAGDCFQETFLSALSAARRQRVDNWGGFLQRLATARALDRLRRRLRQSARAGHLSDEATVPCPEPGPSVQAEAQELNDQLRRALADLPPKQAEAFCLHYLEQWSYQQVGQHLGLATNAVGSLLHRARAGLRDALSSVASGQES